ncbi:Endonuclease/exonuclease/phosphatase [Laetiporus sulphureus 93-53]|uniref:Endonuclease/exonuclease/phosphatase n=1 Tax=Laetiporus sulphureus 93-53 TaxID=1314785 RepID=A0A165DZR6_9APHY|nr:Endonuclease/exonuclease/phosphatase [Laetiporus sulphureus 93-53]KZT05970.1 Endonuclease/exonuclease/phosphatase [Laetiporus sulphureus 93-53]
MAEPHHRTPEQIALAEQRRINREKREQITAKEEAQKGRILPREWITVQDPPNTENGDWQRVRIMTWNLLAQCLVRRELFPTSDCLKASQREPMLHHEILSLEADICCLQEVDRLERLLPVLEEAGYEHVYAAGPRKKHGCLIAYRKDAYILTDQRLIEYDQQEVHEEGSETARRGSSFRTRNIASLVRLQKVASPSTGVVVATTHLFWHPLQAAILLREVVRFREDGHPETRQWPCLIAGDFNFTPEDPTYSFIVGDSLRPKQEERLSASRVVHVTIDPTVPVAQDVPSKEDEDGLEGEEADPDRDIVNARPARGEDGLLTDAELAAMFKKSGRPASVYEEGQRLQPNTADMGLTFGSRVPVEAGRHGGYEPIYTSYTHYWKAVLDYIFVLAPGKPAPIITKLAKPHVAKLLEPGLPQMGVCGSDHISLAAESYLKC